MNKNFFSLAFLTLFVVLFFVPTGVVAISKSYSTTINSSFQYFWNWGEEYADAVGATQSRNWTEGLINPNVTVTYEARVFNHTTNTLIADGSNIPIGTKLRFEPKDFESTDIYWFGTGKSADSPYGHWVSNAGFPSGADSCLQQDYVSTYQYPVSNVGPIAVYVPLSIHPPKVSVSHTGTADLSCNAQKTICTVNSAGSVVSNFTFEETFGRFYYRYNDPQIQSRLKLVGANKQLVTINLKNPRCVGNEVPLRLGTPTSPNVYSIPRSEEDLQQRIQLSGGGTYKFYDGSEESVRLQFDVPKRRIGLGGAVPDAGQPLLSRLFAAVASSFSGAPLAFFREKSYTDFEIPPGLAEFKTPPPTVSNTAPALPNISGPTSGYSGVNYTFRISPGSLLDTRQVRYEVDWDSDGTIDVSIPTSGFDDVVPSQTVSRAWDANGGKKFQVRAAVSGFNSAWKPYTITISSPQQVVVNPQTQTNSNAEDGTYRLPIPETVIISTLEAGDSDIPNPPTISGPTSGTPGTAYTYSFVATDPNGDDIRYRVDWDNNGTVDQTLPGAGYTASGAQLSASRSWSAVGTYTFQAHTEDDKGFSSGWTPYTVTIGVSTPPPASPPPSATQCSDGIDNNGNGLIDYPDDPTCSSAQDNNEEVALPLDLTLTAVPTLVQKNTSATLNWTAQNAREGSCGLSGTNGDSWNLSGTSGSRATGALTGETTYTLSCTNEDNVPVSVQVSVKVAPSFEEI